MSRAKILLAITNGIWLMEPKAVSVFTPTIKRLISGESDIFSNEEKKPSILYLKADGTPCMPMEGEDNCEAEILPGSIAVISITGAIMKYDNCGDCGTSSLIEEVKELDADSNISAIVFVFDSPGGQVAGTEEFANTIKSCTKPTIGLGQDLVASAAYWLISACDEVYLSNKTTQCGSIGTMCSFEDVQPMMEAEGIVFHEVYADASKDKNQEYNQARKGNYDLLKKTLNSINDVFLSFVTTQRGENLNAKETLTGKVFMAEEAVSLGLADGLKSYDETIARAIELASTTKQSSQTNQFNINQSQNPMKLKAGLTAMVAFLATAFTGFKAEETVLTDEHLEKMNAELATLASVITSKIAAETALQERVTEKETIAAALVTANEKIVAHEAEIARLGALNLGATNTQKEGNDTTETVVDENLKVINELAHNKAIDNDPRFSGKKS